MEYNIVYDVDFSKLSEIVEAIKLKYSRELADKNSELSQAVALCTAQAEEAWKEKASMKLHGSNRYNYIRGIHEGFFYPYKGDYLHGRIENFWNPAKYYEHGWGPFDMKKALQISSKVRFTKDGKKYLIIPFEHGAPGSKNKRAMPEDVYKQARKLEPSFITGKRSAGAIMPGANMNDARLLSKFNEQKIERRVYKWGERLKIEYPLERKHWKVYQFDEGTSRQRAVASQPHQTNIYQGMVRFEKNLNLIRENMGDKTKRFLNPSGNTRSSSLYMTFRKMQENSHGWVHPGVRAMYILKEMYDEQKPILLAQMNEASKTAVKRLLPNAKD